MGYGAKPLLQHRPNVPEISAKELLQDGVPVEGCEDVATTTDNVLAYIFTSGTGGQSQCNVVSKLFSRLAYRDDPRKHRFRQDIDMGWWGAAYFG